MADSPRQVYRPGLGQVGAGPIRGRQNSRTRSSSLRARGRSASVMAWQPGASDSDAGSASFSFGGDRGRSQTSRANVSFFPLSTSHGRLDASGDEMEMPPQIMEGDFVVYKVNDKSHWIEAYILKVDESQNLSFFGLLPGHLVRTVRLLDMFEFVIGDERRPRPSEGLYDCNTIGGIPLTNFLQRLRDAIGDHAIRFFELNP